MDIDGLGPAVIEQLIDNKIIADASDLYFLKQESISGLEKMGDKSAENLLNAIDKSRHNPLNKLICAFGIRHVGEKAAKVLAKKYLTLDNLMNATVEELTEVKDIGEKMAVSITEFFKNEKNISFINQQKNLSIMFLLLMNRKSNNNYNW